MPNKESLPVIRTNQREINQIFALFAALEEVEKAQTLLAARIKAIANGKRDMRMIQSVLDKLLVNILRTMPEEKLEAINRMAHRMHYSITFGTQASKIGTDEVLLTKKQMDTIAWYAHEHCGFCTNTECSKCALGKTFDRILAIDRDDRSWAFVDFDEMKE